MGKKKRSVVVYMHEILMWTCRLYNVIKVKLYPTENSKDSRSILKATLGLVPYIYMWAFAFTWLKLWPAIVTEHLALFIMFFGLMFGHQLGLMITAHVSKLDFPIFNWPVIITLGSACTIAYFQDFIEE